MSNNKKSPVIAIVVVSAVVATAILLAWMLFSAFPVGGGSDVARTGSSMGQQGGGAETPASGSSDMQGTDNGMAIPAAPAGLVPADDIDPEQWAEDAREAARALNGGNDPIPCEHACDCPQGMACQQGSQLCFPSPFPMYCCEKDGCPEGQQCVHEDGGYGVCGE